MTAQTNTRQQPVTPTAGETDRQIDTAPVYPGVPDTFTPSNAMGDVIIPSPGLIACMCMDNLTCIAREKAKGRVVATKGSGYIANETDFCLETDPEGTPLRLNGEVICVESQAHYKARLQHLHDTSMAMAGEIKRGEVKGLSANISQDIPTINMGYGERAADPDEANAEFIFVT